MAHQPFGKRFAVAGVPKTLTELLELPRSTTFGPLALRAESVALGQAGRIYLGTVPTVTAAGVDACGYLDPGDSLTIDQGLGSCSTDLIWLVGIPGDVIYPMAITL